MENSSSPLGAAVLGLGRMGATHVAAAKASPFIRRVIGYEPSAETAAERGRELGIATTSNLDEILRDPTLQLIYIASPNETHCDLTVQALRAGKAVLCEKPMGTSLTEAQRMLQTQRETDGFLQIGFELRYSRIYRKVKEWIDAGTIGRPLNSHCDYYCSEGHGRGSWRSNSPTSLIAEKLCHYLDLVRWWFGDEVVEVYALAAPNAVGYFRHADNHQICCRYRGGAISSLTFFMHTAQTFHGDPLQDMLAQQCDDGHRLTYLIYGTRGAIETDVFRRRARRWEFIEAADKLHSHLVETVTYPPEEDLLWIHNTHGQNITVAQWVAQGKRPFPAADDSYESMRLVFAAELSEREHRLVQLSELPCSQGVPAG